MPPKNIKPNNTAKSSNIIGSLNRSDINRLKMIKSHIPKFEVMPP